jgi:superfamily II RNA helicase
MDEFHYYGDPERGWAWQVPLLEMTTSQFLLMSATLGDTTAIRADLTRRTGRPTVEVAHAERPVPLSFEWSLEPVHDKLQELLETRQAPVYVVHATQESAVERAQALMSVNVSTREEKDQIAALLGGFRFTTRFGQTLSRLVRHGIGVHHAGMLPKYRRLVETLAQAGLLKVVCGTDTLGVGINVPIRTVLFTTLVKYDGTRNRHLRAREFHQIAGRAGRAGFDTAGLVVVQAPDHVIDNERALAKIGDDPKRRRSYKRKQPPEGFVSWDEKTFERLVHAAPETLASSFKVSAAMLLNVAARGALFADTWRLLNDNHEPRPRQLRLLRAAIRLYRALEAGGVLEREPGAEPRLTVDLPETFALDQPLALFALAALELLDPAQPSYPLDVLSVVESTLEDPRQVLAAQRKKARGDVVAQLKADGVEYEERLVLLEDVS